MITVSVNEKHLEIDDNTSIVQLLKNTNTISDGIAIAINNIIVPKSDWKSQQLNNNDNILIIQATQGG